MQGFFARALERKKTLIFFAILTVLFAVLGMCVINSPAIYEYHLTVCDGFLTDICYSDTNVFVIFLERAGGCALLALLILVGGIHPVALLLPIAVLVYRAFTFGGSVYVFIDFYKISGAMVVIILYLPIHLAADVILIFAATITCGRAFHFSFCRTDLWGIVCDFFTVLFFIALVYLAEMLLLLALFHPIGKIL